MPYDWEHPPLALWEQEGLDPHWNPDEAGALKSTEEKPPDGGILLGTNTAGKNIWITPESLRTHMHVVGATNVGKSFFLEGIIKSLILH